jgi:hypothetical protein
MNSRRILNKSIHEKWPGALQVSFKPAWSKVWDKSRAKKEAAFMWSVWHNAIAANAWRRKIYNGVSDLCPCCELDAEVTPQCIGSTHVHERAIYGIMLRALFID